MFVVYNVNTKRIFSLITSQRTRKRNKLTIGSERVIVTLQFNFKSLTCLDFRKNRLKPENKTLLQSIRTSN